MVFIDRIKDIIKIFEECSREEIGISLLAYEEFICKGLKVSNKDLEKLKEIFNYYDEEFSDDYPSLTNEILQDSDKLINDYFKDNYKIIKDDRNIDIDLSGRYDNTAYFDVKVKDKFGYPESELKFSVEDKNIKSDYGKDSFNTTYKACEKVYKEIKKMDIKSMMNTFKF